MNVTNLTSDVQTNDNSFTWDKFVIGITLYFVTLITIFGNVLVLIAVKVEKKLQTTFNYYIVNLAVTDVAVAVTAMSFKATHTVLGHWPFGEILCGIWIFFDYGMTFVSVFTLILISIDRFWCVAWSISYRHHHTKKRCLMSILSVWMLMLMLWVPPCILDRMRHSEPGVCFWDPSLNQELVYIVATIGHHMPYTILVFCYTYVFVFMRKRAKVSNFARARTKETQNMSRQISTIVSNEEPTVSSHIPATYVQPNQIPANQETVCKPITKIFNTLKVQNSEVKLHVRSDNNIDASRASKERKVFVTMTYIVVAYAILWLPFHIIFDISISEPLLVPEQIWELAFWLTYLNSTVNPFLYNFSSPEFRTAFRKILRKQH